MLCIESCCCYRSYLQLIYSIAKAAWKKTLHEKITNRLTQGTNISTLMKMTMLPNIYLTINDTIKSGIDEIMKVNKLTNNTDNTHKCNLA